MRPCPKRSAPPLVVEEVIQEMLARLDASDQSAKDMLWFARSNGMAVDELTESL